MQFDVTVSYGTYYMYHVFSECISNMRPSPLDICPRLRLGQISRGSGLGSDTHLEAMVYILHIPLKYPIIRYEIGYHHLNDKCCFMADVDNINIQVLNRSNVSSDSTVINITGLSDNIFGVRAGTVNGYGEWTVIANETLELQSQPSPQLCKY